MNKVRVNDSFRDEAERRYALIIERHQWNVALAGALARKDSGDIQMALKRVLELNKLIEGKG